jgi:asparagine synthase (glutamine-hydrolysing)
MERAFRRGHDFRFRPRCQSLADRYEGLRRWEAGLQVTRGYEALFGVQTRNPTGDVRLVEFCLSLPEDQHRHDGVPRSLIQRAMKDFLPPDVLGNRRRGVQAADWLERAKADQARMLDELTRIEHSELASSALDLERIRELVQRLHETDAGESGTVNLQAVLASAFMVGSFLRWFESGMKWEEGDRSGA